MNYIVFDLEFNQDCSYKSNKKCPFEIIQIGALTINENLEKISTFNRYVKPKVFTEVNPFISKLTGITSEKLNSEQHFDKVYPDFLKFINNSENVFCVWGASDVKELFRNVNYHKLDSKELPRKYINLQSYVSKYFNSPKGTVVGLGKALEFLNIASLHKFHDAFNDAYYTYEIFQRLYHNLKIEPSEYDPSVKKSRRTLRQRRRIVDFPGLIQQFEKMYDRDMTNEEKDLIRLAYMMGKTHQFIK